MADVTVRDHLPQGSAEDGSLGPTVTDLSKERCFFFCEPTKVYTQLIATLRRPIKHFHLYYK